MAVRGRAGETHVRKGRGLVTYTASDEEVCGHGSARTEACDCIGQGRLLMMGKTPRQEAAGNGRKESRQSERIGIEGPGGCDLNCGGDTWRSCCGGVARSLSLARSSWGIRSGLRRPGLVHAPAGSVWLGFTRLRILAGICPACNFLA